MLVSEAVGAALTGLGADTVFGVVGSGNFHVTNALIARGATFYAARHEGGAACMADGWARAAGRVGLLCVHQGPGLTNAMTGITEAAKSRTPLLVLAADVAGAAVLSNFRIDVAALATSVGAEADRLHSPGSAVSAGVRGHQPSLSHRRAAGLAAGLFTPRLRMGLALAAGAVVVAVAAFSAAAAVGSGRDAQPGWAA